MYIVWENYANVRVIYHPLPLIFFLVLEKCLFDALEIAQFMAFDGFVLGAM